MKKRPYFSPDVICLDIMTGAVLAASDDSVISSLDFIELEEE